ncbi:HAD family hydrolase [Hyphomonas johnsonii]|jgi:HAD superfamily hydrolase (TIGR01490 family)|uniref:HAD family hydrolase n=1 Tax=Hyphomonas johnsonii MHS-2 TaxID=1280950 RepID=A0A059FBG2_9PROT|nr:HAD-IB family hydrolase [Hyphomonas johnsonii]KCZ87932.1 HAD family hydrolase [Hyphomonas johnsonii MHS-2]
MPGTAIFDLDKTITRAPTWTRFVFFVNRARVPFLLRLPWLIGHGIAHKMGLASRDSVKAHSLRTLAWLDRDALEEAADTFIAREVAQGLHPGAVAAIKWHARRGDRLVIATAAVDLLADRLAAALGFDQVIATRLDWTTGGKVRPPRLAGLNCYGTEKLRRIDDCRFHGPVFAYSDHVSDLAMLAQADHGIAVNPSRGLRRAAPGHQVRVVDYRIASGYPHTSGTSEVA